MNALTSSMLQFGVSLKDPTAAAGQAAMMMNVMAAAAQEGSVEIPEITAAIDIAGTSAKNAGVSYQEMNAAIQTLGKASIVGAEAGTALRNVFVRLQAPTEEARKVMAQYGIDADKVGMALSKDGLAGAVNVLRDGYMKIQNPMDRATLLNRMFGEAAQNAGTALIENVDYMQKLTAAVTDTSSAFDQANTVMDTNTERLARLGAILENTLVGVVEDAAAVVGELFGALENLANLDLDNMGQSVGRATTAFVNFSTLGLADTFASWVFGAESLDEALGLVARRAVDVQGTLSKVANEQENIARGEAAIINSVELGSDFWPHFQAARATGRGIFLCGAAHYPKSIDEAISQAYAAAGRAAAILAKPALKAGGVVAEVDQDKCAACLTCVRICPYEVPLIEA
jgi:TP901 family phage tail tape measure protein